MKLWGAGGNDEEYELWEVPCRISNIFLWHIVWNQMKVVNKNIYLSIKYLVNSQLLKKLKHKKPLKNFWIFWKFKMRRKTYRMGLRIKNIEILGVLIFKILFFLNQQVKKSIPGRIFVSHIIKHHQCSYSLILSKIIKLIFVSSKQKFDK